MWTSTIFRSKNETLFPNCSRNIPETFQEHSGNIPGTLRELYRKQKNACFRIVSEIFLFLCLKRKNVPNHLIYKNFY
jgi:hypothetical protein